jgi:hypothetical protein
LAPAPRRPLDGAGPPSGGGLPPDDAPPPAPSGWPVYPDIVIQTLACFNSPDAPVSRKDLGDAILAALADLETTLRKQGISLFQYDDSYRPEFHGNCLTIDGIQPARETDGVWGNHRVWFFQHYPETDAEKDQVLERFDLYAGLQLEPSEVLGGSAVIVLTGPLLDRIARAMQDFISARLPRAIVLGRMDVALEPPKRIRFTVSGHGVAPMGAFPFDVCPPEFSATLVATLSIATDPFERGGKQKLHVHLKIDGGADFPWAERLFLDAGLVPFAGLFPGLLPPPFFEAIVAALQGSGEADLDLALPAEFPIPSRRGAVEGYLNVDGQVPPVQCAKVPVEYVDIDTTSTRPAGIRLRVLFHQPVHREPRVSIRAFHEPIQVRYSHLLNQRIPTVQGQYKVEDLQDLRGDLEQMRFNWQAERGDVSPGPPPGVVTVYFDLARERFQPGTRLQRTVSVTVTDVDGCIASTSLPITIEILPDPDEFDRSGPPAGRSGIEPIPDDPPPFPRRLGPVPGSRFSPVPGDFRPIPGDFRPIPGDFKPFPGDFKPFPGDFKPFPGDFKPFSGDFRPFPGDFKPFPGGPVDPGAPSAPHPIPGSSFGPARGGSRPIPGGFRPGRGGLRPMPGGVGEPGAPSAPRPLSGGPRPVPGGVVEPGIPSAPRPVPGGFRPIPGTRTGSRGMETRRGFGPRSSIGHRPVGPAGLRL